MRDEVTEPSYRVAIVTLDAHAAGPAARVEKRLARDFPGLIVTVHAAAEWGEGEGALAEAREAVLSANLVIANLLFLEEHVSQILPELTRARDTADAFVGMVADGAIVRLTRMGDLDMAKPSSTSVRLLRKLRGSRQPSGASGEKQMRLLRRLPRLLRFIPGKAQDLRAWFLSMQYWLSGSDDNVEEMLRFLLGRYAPEAGRTRMAKAPVEYPDVALYHPDLPARISESVSDLPAPKNSVATVGLLMMRSYILASDTAHYDAVIRSFEKRGIQVIPAFAGGLDGRPAIDRYFIGQIDALVSLTGFSLVGGPAYNDSDAAVKKLAALDVPYIAAHPLEFQTLDQWEASAHGLGPVETTILVALPEIDGATNPTVFAGRSGGSDRAMSPHAERIEALTDKVARLARLRRKARSKRNVAIVLYGFPPNAGAAGTAAYLSVFESLFNILHAMKGEGFDLEPPESVDALRAAILHGNAVQYGQEANVAAQVTADEMVAKTPWLEEIEAAWGPVPGRHQSDGRGVFILGQRFGKVFVGIQPAFGYEGDPMRLLFEKGFAPTHAFVQFYRWLRDDFAADAVLHFGMHGALEFMPGKQAGPGATCWPDRLIGGLPNIYLYAANNPSEATLAKRRSNAVTVTHLTPPLATAGLYKGLHELKESVTRWRSLSSDAIERTDLALLIEEQAKAVDLDGTDPDALWQTLIETEQALITDGLHIVGQPKSREQRAAFLSTIPDLDVDVAQTLSERLAEDTEIPAVLRALDARFIAPVAGGDLIRSPEILPTGRNIHAFDPFRMPTAFALENGRRQAERLLATHPTLPRSIAMVLWGSDNIKSDGGPIAQALALLGAVPRFDSYGRLSGADLIPLADLSRPRIDVVMTISGIFRDLLPLQTKMLAEAAWKAATADEPDEMNFVKAHAFAYAQAAGCDIEGASLRVFSNAEGAYGSNVNHMIDSSAFADEDDLADAYEKRKSFAYGRNGKAAQQAALLTDCLGRVDVAYQNLESVELGVTTVDHYFDTLGGISRSVRRAKGSEAAVYIGDQTRGGGKIRTLKDQIALETRSRSLNPRFFEPLLKHGHEGVRQIEAHVTNTLGWSATTGQVEPWVYQRISETYVLDEEMRRRLAELNPQASMRMANRLLEASDRAYWDPDESTLAALQGAADELEDRMEGIAAE